MNDVTVVMPAYNEQACINEVIDDWKTHLDKLNIDYNLLIINDGSRDNTAHALEKQQNNPCVRVVNKENSGHGPTILTGYHLAVENAGWVFQADSDNEIRAEHFQTLWNERHGYDAVFGSQSACDQALPRRIINFISRMTVTIYYGRGVQDVNCPFRLMRSSTLRKALQHIPADTLAPNVAISGLFVLTRRTVKNIAVPHSNRHTSEVSIKKWKLFKAAIKSFLQTRNIRSNL